MSDDPFTKVPALIVKKEINKCTLTGYGVNHIPHSIDSSLDDYSPEAINSLLTDRNWKINNIHHAEHAAIEFTRKLGNQTEGNIMYMPWVPCSSCADKIIATGIIELVGHRQMILKTPERWHESTNQAIDQLKQKGVRLLMYDGPIGGVISVFNSEVWTP